MSESSSDRFDGARREERFVALAAEQILGVSAVVWDIGGRQNAVDLHLTYPDGRTAGLEITRASSTERGRLEGKLSQWDHTLPSPPNSRWTWTAHVAEADDLHPLQARLPRLIQVFEENGISAEHQMWRLREDQDVAWLLSSSVTLFAFRSAPSGPNVYVMPAGGGGAVDEEYRGLNHFLAKLFIDQTAHVDKATRHPADEHHLCFLVDSESAGFSVADAICRSPSVPSTAPPMPDGLTHLWLIGRQYGGQALIWSTESGWTSHQFADLNR